MASPDFYSSRWWASLALLLVSAVSSLLLGEAFLRWVVPYRFIYHHPEFVVEQVDPADRAPEMAEPLFGAGLRYVDEPWAYGLKRNMRARLVSSEFDVLVQTDEHGLRIGGVRPGDGVHPVSGTAGAGPIHLLGLGDSFAMGYGVEHDESYLALLASGLAGPDSSVTVNAAVVGYNPGHSYEYLANAGLALKPDLVVFQLWSGDDLCGGLEPTPPARAGSLSLGLQLRYAVRASHLGMLLRDSARGVAAVRGWLFERDLALRFTSEGMLQPGFAQRCGESLAGLADMLTRASRLCREAGARFVVVLIPLREQVYPEDLERVLEYNLSERTPADLDLQGPSAALRQSLSGRDVDLVDLLPEFRARANAEWLFYRMDPHLTRAGHAAVARALLGHLAVDTVRSGR